MTAASVRTRVVSWNEAAEINDSVASDAFNQKLSEDRADEALHYLLGRIHERRRNHLEATAAYRKVIKEMELVQLDYQCRNCRAASPDWTDRCATCGEWNVIEVNFREEIPLEDLGIAAAPIYTTKDGV